MARSKSRYLADLLGVDGDVKYDKFDSGAQADLSNVLTIPASLQSQLKGDKGDQGDQGIQGIQGIQGEEGDEGVMPPATEDVVGIYTDYKT